jgi:hypothetical protein
MKTLKQEIRIRPVAASGSRLNRQDVVWDVAPLQSMLHLERLNDRRLTSIYLGLLASNQVLVWPWSMWRPLTFA